MSKTIDLGAVTAYAIAKEHGYTGTESQFATEMTGAAQSARAAAQDASDAEAYAVGKRDGTDVPSTDPAYHNNAKYWANTASGANVANAFDTAMAYSVGDYVLYNGTMYRFTTAHPAGAWDASHATAVKAMDEITDLKDGLNQNKVGLNLLGKKNRLAEYSGTVSGTRYKNIEVDIEAGALTIDIASIVSSDTDASTCKLLFRDTKDILTIQVPRENNVSINATLTRNATSIWFYASDSPNNSFNDTFTFTDVVVSRGISDKTLTVSGGFADAKAVADRINWTSIGINDEFLLNYYYPISTGILTQLDAWIATDLLLIEPGKFFVLSGQSDGFYIHSAYLYDKNKSPIDKWNFKDIYTDKILSSYPNARYIAFNIKSDSYSASIPQDFTDGWELKAEKISSVKSVLNGKKITVIGDSITTSSGSRAKKPWPTDIAEWCGASVQNLGVSGSGFKKSNPYINRISSIQENPDIIGIAVSFNDLANSTAIGTITDTTSDETIAGYMNDFFDSLLAAFPTTPIICYSQGPWSDNRPGIERSDALINISKEICRLKGIPFYSDLYNGCVLRPWNTENKEIYYKCDNESRQEYGQTDGTHPNSEGNKIIARYLYPKFAQNIISDGLDYLE